MNSSHDADMAANIRANLDFVYERIQAALHRSGRPPGVVKLVLVTKAQPLAVAQAAYDAGARIFGENYADQAVPKIEGIQAGKDLQWHMIGHIQSRKAEIVSKYFDFVHSVDSLKIASRLNRYAVEQAKVLSVLLELNLGGEPTKSGWMLRESDPLDALLTDFKEIAAMPNLVIHGLMTMPPFFENPEYARPYFRRLACLSKTLAQKLPGVNWPELSMGTSVDFEAAVEEGATFIRVGQAVLGVRPPV